MIYILCFQIFTIAVSGNIASYLQNANKKGFVWRYDFHLVSIAATAITCYVWLVPLALWAALKWTSSNDAHDEIENQVCFNNLLKKEDLNNVKKCYDQDWIFKHPYYHESPLIFFVYEK